MPTSAQSVDWAAVAPPLLVAAAGARRCSCSTPSCPPARRQVTGWLAALGLVGALGLLVPLVGDRRATFCVPGRRLALPSCSYVVDDLTLPSRRWCWPARPSSCCSPSTRCALGGIPPGEYWFLLLASVAGALTLAASRDLLTLVVAWRSSRCRRSRWWPCAGTTAARARRR